MKTDLVEEVSYWSNLSPIWENFFKSEKAIEMVDFCDVVTENHPNRKRLNHDFINALASIPIYDENRTKAQSDHINNLLMPVFNLAISMVKSDQYISSLIKKEISGEAKIVVGCVEIPLTEKELILHIRRTNALPLIPKDLVGIQKDLIKYMRELYTDQDANPSQRYQYDIELIVRVFNYCNGTVFKCDITFFLNCVGFADFSELKPLVGSKIKIPYIINNLYVHGMLPEEWYAKAVSSMGLKKSDCTGKAISSEWTEGLYKAIKNKQK